MKRIIGLLIIILFITSNSNAGDAKGAINKLQSSAVGVRYEGTKELEDMKIDAVPALVDSLNEDFPDSSNLKPNSNKSIILKHTKASRMEMMRILSKTKDERGIEPIGKALIKSSNKDEREMAAICLGINGNKKGAPYLKQALKDEDKTVKLRAAFALGRIGDNSGLSTAAQYTNDNDPKIREEAIEAIGMIGSQEGKAQVNQALNDSNVWVKIKAKIAKKQIQIHDLSGQDRIIFLQNTLENDEQYEVQKWAAGELIESGPVGIDLVKQIAKDQNNKGSLAAYKSLKRYEVEIY